jgi:phosphoglycolate phosphatase-like HAD superfamily hydrolase
VKLLLFDIDGTLINGNKAGRMAMGAAMEQMFGTKGMLETYPMGGKTDLGIITDVLSEAGLPIKQIHEKAPAFFQLMAEMAENIYPGRGITPCPGIEELLKELRDRKGVLLGLLTGNARPTASMKLAAAGIDPEQFIVGAYGSENLSRNNLPAIALRRAKELTGLDIAGDNAVIIGDTPADIECARAGMARAVAVASGWHPIDVLEQKQPDFLFADFGDTQAVLNALLA